jgi:GMP synthase (glutamine-hydrolysing)
LTKQAAKRADVIRHTPLDDLGAFRPVLERAGYSINIIEPFHDDVTAVDPAAADLLVVLGGAIGVHDAGTYPFLTDEIRLVEKRLATGKPLLGSCLGGQIMAAASGARVYKNSLVEVGYLPVTLTEAGKQSPLAALAVSDYHAPHWHGDAFDLPRGASRLAYSDLTENQAFSFGANALALQFHIEACPRIVGGWLVAYTGDIKRASMSVEEFRAAVARHGALTAEAGARMLATWLEGCRPE